MKGPRVSGPWLDSWGSNANVLRHSTFYTHHFSPFLLCGTMFPLILNVQVTWHYVARRIRSRCVNHVDVESTGSSIKHVRLKGFKRTRSTTHLATRGFIKRMRFNAILAHRGETCGGIMTVRLKIRRWELKKIMDP